MAKKINGILDMIEKARDKKISDLMETHVKRLRVILTPEELEAVYEYGSNDIETKDAIVAGWKMDTDHEAYEIFCKLHRAVMARARLPIGKIPSYDEVLAQAKEAGYVPNKQ